MTTEEKLIKNKLGLLELANYLKNVSEACRVMGYSRDTFYRVRKAYEDGGIEALKEKSRRKPNVKNRISEDVENSVVQMAYEQPAYGQKRVSDELRQKGIFISAAGVRCVWLRHGLQTLSLYIDFQSRADKVKNDFLRFLLDAKQKGDSVVAYGAAAKGNTLLNYAGVKPDLLPMVCDAAASKQGKYLPGSHIPIVAPQVINKIKPDIILVLPWNIKAEIMKQLGYVKNWGCQFVTFIPEINIG